MKTKTCLLVLCLALFCLLLLAACGDDSKPAAPPPNMVVTIQPQPAATILPGCEAGELESWFEVAGTLIQTFKDDSLNGLGNEPAQTVAILNRLIDLRDAIADQPTPECAVGVQGEILIQIRGVLTAYQRYVNGDLPAADLRSQVEAAAGHIDTEVAALLAGTQAGLEDQLREQRATSAPQ